MNFKRIALMLCALMLFSFVPLEAKNMAIIEEKTKTGLLYGVDQIYAPVSKTEVGKSANAFIQGFKTDKKDNLEILQDLAMYFARSRYQYKNITNGLDLIPEMEKGNISCFGYTLLSAKILDRQKVPYKIINVALRKKNKDVVYAHTCLIVKINDNEWVRFEPTGTASYKNNVEYMGKKLAGDDVIRNTIRYNWKESINSLVDFDEGNLKYFYIMEKGKLAEVKHEL